MNFLSSASSSTLFIKVSDPTKEPTNNEYTPLCNKTPLAAHSLGVTANIGHLGLCLATFLAVKPEWVNTIIKLALTSNEALTAQLDIVSSVDQLIIGFLKISW